MAEQTQQPADASPAPQAATPAPQAEAVGPAAPSQDHGGGGGGGGGRGRAGGGGGRGGQGGGRGGGAGGVADKVAARVAAVAAVTGANANAMSPAWKLPLSVFTAALRSSRRPDLQLRRLVVAGDRRGNVGIGYGKANEVPPAVEKATKDAKKQMFKVNLKGTDHPSHGQATSGASTVILVPARPGTGVTAGKSVRPCMELAGITDILTKAYGRPAQEPREGHHRRHAPVEEPRPGRADPRRPTAQGRGRTGKCLMSVVRRQLSVVNEPLDS